MSETLTRQAAGIIHTTPNLVLATSPGGERPQPRNVWLFFGYEPAGNQLYLYWTSRHDSRHSRVIRDQNPMVGIGIADSTASPGTGVGLSIEAVAVELTDPEEIARGRAAGGLRSPARDPDETFTGTAPRRVYRATPERIEINQLDTPLQVATLGLVRCLEDIRNGN
ncbi:MAG TPA: pyridoxamine 5'-phosphate oxidase family protein [Nevskiaceae bacterium]|nr:pyridoxamine 5'-phosphate oxidase family protein [Nevskiaceae bacterium]